MIMLSKLKEAIFEETEKIMTAFVSWGVGIFLMIIYSLFVYWLNTALNIYWAIVGALLFLAVYFFFIDLWWSYNRKKLLGRD